MRNWGRLPLVFLEVLAQSSSYYSSCFLKFGGSPFWPSGEACYGIALLWTTPFEYQMAQISVRWSALSLAHLWVLVPRPCLAKMSDFSLKQPQNGSRVERSFILHIFIMSICHFQPRRRRQPSPWPAAPPTSPTSPTTSPPAPRRNRPGMVRAEGSAAPPKRSCRSSTWEIRARSWDVFKHFLGSPPNRRCFLFPDNTSQNTKESGAESSIQLSWQPPPLTKLQTIAPPKKKPKTEPTPTHCRKPKQTNKHWAPPVQKAGPIPPFSSSSGSRNCSSDPGPGADGT